MKHSIRTTVFLIVLLSALPLFAAPTITVSGTSVSLLNSSLPCSITVTLIDPNHTGMLKAGSTIVTGLQSSTVTPGGTCQVGPIWGNDVIQDGFGNFNGTYYKVSVFLVTNGIVASTPSLSSFYAFQGSGTVDLATATPLAPSFMTGTGGSVSMPGVLSLSDGTAAAPSLTFSSIPGVGFRHRTSNFWSWVNGSSVEAFYISPNGAVGLGGTNPAALFAPGDLATNPPDAGISRTAAATLTAGNGTAGDGSGTFKATTLLGTSAAGGSVGAVVAQANTSTNVVWSVPNGAADQKFWDFNANSTVLAGRAVNDAVNAANSWVQVTRGSGFTISTVQFPVIGTISNCNVNSVSPAACGSAPSGVVVVPTTTVTYTVSTTAVTANSRIQVWPITDNSGVSGAPTCNAPPTPFIGYQSARVAGTSFTFTLPSTTGTSCWNYSIVN